MHDKYSDVFKGLGCLGHDYDITLREDSKSVVHAPRRVPLQLK